MRIGIAGFAGPTGIGALNHDMARRLPASSWLIPEHPKLGWAGAERADASPAETYRMARDDPNPPAINEFLASVDAVVAVERTIPDDLFLLAHAHDLRTVLIAMAEYTWAGHDWVAGADLLIGYNDLTQTAALECMLGVPGQEVVKLACPLDLARFPRHVRGSAIGSPVFPRVRFCNGWGGFRGRKGWEVVRTVLEIDPGFCEIQSQVPIKDAPAGTVILSAVEDPRDLYDQVGVAVQPSLFEGLGLSILEAMASGVVVVTTDAEPMREYMRAAHGDEADRLLVPVREERTVRVDGRDWTAHVADPAELVRVVRGLDSPTRARLSAQALEYTMDTHGNAAWVALREAIEA